MSSSAAQSSGKASGGQLEERVDLSAETATKIAQARDLVSSSSSASSSGSSALQDALAILAALEKRCRLGNDAPSLVKVCEASLDLCHDVGDPEALLGTLKTLTTRRSQKTKAIAALVHRCLPWVVDVDADGFTPLPHEGMMGGEAARDALVEELRSITDGKMYLEAERARLTRTMAIIKERKGDASGAADVLQEVHVETYGSLSKREKVEFILEQMRLTLLKRDYIRSYIVSNKVKRGVLDEEGMAELKVKFYSLLAKYYAHEKDAFELAKCHHNIYSTPTVQEVEPRWREALTNSVVFLCLSEYSNEVKDMMERINLDPRLDKIPECRDAVSAYLRNEIIHYPLPYQDALESASGIVDACEVDDGAPPGGTIDIIGSSSSSLSKSSREHWHETFHSRIIEHNLRVTSIYYRRIRTSRLSTLLNLDVDATERHISHMVSTGMVYAKIDRPKDEVRFMKKRCEEEVLSDWASDIGKLLGLVEETTYLIHKERMVQSY
jgi:26S proteasome regulatory subunit N5